MSCPVSKDALDKLKQFIEVCKSNPPILHTAELKFFKDYIESFGGEVPETSKMSTHTKTASKNEARLFVEVGETAESDSESEIEFDMTGCVEPDKLDDNQKMRDQAKEVSEEDSYRADERRIEAMKQLSEGNLEEAVKLFTEAIDLNPHSALLYAKRGQAYLRLLKPNACIRDCTRALEINCDSAAAYKFRGRAYRLLGEWQLAAKDLRQACNIDYDEQTDEWLREVTPNAKKIEEHLLKKDRIKKEKEEKDRLERVRKAREPQANASACDAESESEHVPTGTCEMGDFYKLLQDPEIMAGFQDPEVAAAFQDISTNPANFLKYQSNPKIMDLITKISNKFSGTGMNIPGFGNMPNFPPGGFSFQEKGKGGIVPPPKPTDDDNLD